MHDAAYYLPIVFLALMGISMLLYVVLDGFDLGVGMLFAGSDDAERDRMLATIGPFWDANETWLVLGIGILLIAFPQAHGVILTALYVPVAVMLFGLIARGVAFDFRAKARAAHKRRWDTALCLGSLTASFAQGFMLGQFIGGFEYSALRIAFSGLIGACVCAGYVLIGACWLIIKTEGELQKRAVHWAKRAWWAAGAGILLVSAVTPLVNPRIFAKWFSLPELILLSPIPLATGALFFALRWTLGKLPQPNDAHARWPFAMVIGIIVLCFHGLAYSFFPFIVPEKLTVWQAASAPESLAVILVGVGIVLPMILAYSYFSYHVFRGKAGDLSYD